jgi:hypothetical protein
LHLLIAQSQGKMTPDFRVFFMGHKGSIEARYTTHKGTLPQSLVNEMRENFRNSEGYIDLEKNTVDPLEQTKKDLEASMSQMLQNAKSPEELAKVQKLLCKLGSGKPKASESNKNNKESLQLETLSN